MEDDKIEATIDAVWHEIDYWNPIPREVVADALRPLLAEITTLRAALKSQQEASR